MSDTQNSGLNRKPRFSVRWHHDSHSQCEVWRQIENSIPSNDAHWL